ncbi:MAG: UbiA family prenyltransferase [Candidatus Methanomethylophilaceae archaeon]
MNKYLQLFRLGNCAMGIIGIIVSAFIAVGLDTGDYWQNLIISCFIVVIFIAGGNSINDYIDRDIDITSHPDRPIPSGKMNAKHALYIGTGALIISCLLSLLLKNVMSTLIVIIACILIISYELFLKQRGFVGNVTIALLTGMVFLLGGAIVGHIENSYVVAILAALVSIGREITKDIEDMEGDRGRFTLPMKIGKKNAGIIAAIFFVAGPALSLWPIFSNTLGYLYLTVLIADAMFVYAALILFNDPHKAQKTAKFAMIVALVAFILGVI